MDPVDPGAGQVGQGGEVGLAGQPLGLEAAHLAGRGGTTVQPAAIDHRAHRRVVGQALGVVDVLVAGEAAEHGLAQQPGQQVAGVPAAAALRQDAAGQIGQPQRVVEVAVGEQPGVGGDAAAVELQLQAAVEIDPQRPVIQFTRWVFHGAATEDAASCWKADQISLNSRQHNAGHTGNPG